MAKAGKVVNRGIYLYIDGKQVKNSITEIEKEMRALERAQKKMTVGSEEYVRAGQKIRSLKGIYAEHRTQLRAVTQEVDRQNLSVGRLADSFNRYAGMATGIIAGLTGITLTVRKAVNSYAEMEEAERQVMKYTGMTGEEVMSLNDELKKFDTRTTRERLNALAGDAGRLGIQGKDDILEFVDAANVINVALGEDLGEDAVKNIGKLAQMFGEDKEKGLRGAMLATGSAINEVAQNSSAAEAYLVGFTARVAGVAKQANLSQTDILGYASVLDQNMQQQEMAATAFQGLMIKMFKYPAKFAKMAGASVKDFTKLLREDANEAILQLLETLSKKGGLEKLAPMFEAMQLDGARASGVLSTMAGKINDIRAAQQLANEAYNEGTSVINEYNVQNNTVKARIEKNINTLKEYVITLGEKLLPVANKFITTGSIGIKLLGTLTDFLIKNSGAIITLTTIIVAYYTALKVQNMWIIASNALLRIGTTLRILYAAATANVTGNQAGANKILTIFSASITRNNLLLKASTALTYLYSAAIQLLKGNLQAASMAMKSLWATIAINPIGLLVAAVAAVTIVSYRLTKQVKDYYDIKSALSKLQEKVNNQLQKETQKVEELKNLIHDNTASLRERKTAIEDLQKILPSYRAEINAEGHVVNENTKALNNMNKELRMNIELRELSDELTERKKNLEKLKNSPAFKDNSLMGSMSRDTDVRNKISQEEAIIAELMKRYEDLAQAKSAADFKIKLETDSDIDPEQLTIMKLFLEKRSELRKKYLDGEIKSEQEYNKRVSELKQQELKALSPGTDIDSSLDPDEKAVKAARMRVMAQFEQKKNELRKKYLAGDIETQQEYEQQLQAIELESLQALMKIHGLKAEDREQYQAQYLDMKVALRKKIEDINSDTTKDAETEFDKQINALRKKQEKEEEVYKMAHHLQVISAEELQKYLLDRKEYYAKQENEIIRKKLEKQERQYEESADKITKALVKKYERERNLLESRENDVKVVGINPFKMGVSNDPSIFRPNAGQEYLNTIRELRSELESELLALSESGIPEETLSKVREEMGKELDSMDKMVEDKARSIADSLTDIGEEMGDSLTQVFEDGMKGLYGFLKDMLTMLLSAIEKEMIAAQISLLTKALMNSMLDPSAIAKALGKIAIIKASFALAKAAISNFYSGGYTGNGPWDEPAGVVHRKEFVANRFSVANPNIRPVLDLLDAAQRSGTAASLTSEDLAAVSNHQSGGSLSVNRMDASRSGDQNVADPALLLTLSKVNRTLEQVKERFNEPIVAETYATGKRGVNEAQKLVSKMEANASRKR